MTVSEDSKAGDGAAEAAVGALWRNRDYLGLEDH
jgi:hypothetical protein